MSEPLPAGAPEYEPVLFLNNGGGLAAAPAWRATAGPAPVLEYRRERGNSNRSSPHRSPPLPSLSTPGSPPPPPAHRYLLSTTQGLTEPHHPKPFRFLAYRRKSSPKGTIERGPTQKT
jgi:hypothetical protein